MHCKFLFKILNLPRVAAQLELDFNSVERVVEYLDIPQEAPAVIEDHRPPAYWPSSSGRLVVDNLSVKYAPSLPAVLKNLSFTIEPSEKIGVVCCFIKLYALGTFILLNSLQVGRTGSGKSTLALSILRMIEPAGGRIMYEVIPLKILNL